MRKDTLLAHAGRQRVAPGVVNAPVARASTIWFESIADFERAQKSRYEVGELYYGTYGTQTTFAFEAALAALEGGHGAIAVSSGLAAIVATLLAFVSNGEHVLVPDSAYSPVRSACDGILLKHGIETTYYDPAIGAEIASLVRPNTRLIYLESPGSLTFEVQDVPAIVAVARERGLPTAIDNTWATPYYFDAIAHGVDVSIHAATKYLGGHSDLILGAIVANAASYERIRRTVTSLGYNAAPDDCWLALRGMRTLGVRLRAHGENATRVATYLASQPQVARVLYPALPGAPGHELWKRDFTGATGLFSFVLAADISETELIAAVDRLQLFAIGASWGGYESLVMLARPEQIRSATRWEGGTLIRLSIGLEDPGDLIADLAQAFGWREPG